MYKVETHNNSREYYEHLKIEDNAVYITATTSLSNMIREVGKVSIEEKWRVLDIETFIKYLYPNWTNTINQVKLVNEVRQAILVVKDRIHNEKETKELKFLEDNISILYSDFKYIIEAGVRKLNYDTNDIKLKLIKEIFNIFTERELFKSISDEILNIEKAKDLKANLIGNYLRNLRKIDVKKEEEAKRLIQNKSSSINKIYFYNISNLDIKRYMIAEILKYAGYEVIFRIPYYKDLNVVNKCWDMVYSNSNLFNIEINNKYTLPNRSNTKYVDFLQGNEARDKIKENVQVKSYREVYDYKKVIKDKMVITLCKDNLQAIMERDKLSVGNHCYQNAIGRFLFNLYNCKLEDNQIKMSFDTYREMITSGWIEAIKWNGVKLYSYLVENENYFLGVTTLDEIIERIEKLKDIDEISNIFEEQAKDKIKKNSTKQFLSNPFRAFNYANFEKYNITINYMLEVTLKLKRFLIKALESKNEIINVKEHFDLLFQLFKNSYIKGIYNNGTEIEKQIIIRVHGLLKNHDKFGDFVHKDSVRDLFNVYLVLDNDKEVESQQESDLSIDQLEGLIYRDNILKANKGILYVGDMSYKAYQKYIEKYNPFNKILDDNDLEFIFNSTLRGKNKESALNGLKLQKLSKSAGESYFKFALANLFINYDGNIEFSWIEGLRDNDSKAIVLKQIEALYGKVNDVPQYLDDDYFVDATEIEEIESYVYDVKKIAKEVKAVPEVAFRDLDFCGDKFLYSSILEGNPAYSTDFHQRLAFSSLISIFKNNIEDGYVNMLKFVLPLFPQWQDVVKRNVLDCEFSRKGLREYRYFEGINYPKSTDALYLLKSKYIVTENNKIRNRYNKGEFNGDRYYKEFIDEYIKNEQNNSGLHCKMCPHNYLCKKGEFVIDRK